MRHLALLPLLFMGALHAAEPIAIDVYRDANCGCCKAWISHLQNNGFKVADHVEPDMSAVKTRLGVPNQLGSCHTAVIDGKFVEGHVPAADILKLRERSDLKGIAVPGMPLGSPGMEYGDKKAPYSVVGIKADGSEEVLSSYNAQ